MIEGGETMGRIVRVLIAGTVAAAMLAAPGVSSAAQTIGSSLVPDKNCQKGTFYMTNMPSRATDPFLVPADGVITSWAYEGPGKGVPFSAQLKVGIRISKEEFRTDANGEAIEVKPGSRATTEARVPVLAGQRIGVWITGIGPGEAFCQASGAPESVESYFRNAEPKDQEPGMTGKYIQLGAEIPPVSAVIEPDADRDGYGDETQDLCATNPGPGPCPPPVTPAPPSTGNPGAGDGSGGDASGGSGSGAAPTKPTLTGFSLAHATTLKSAAGAKVSFVLSEQGSVTLTVARQVPGRRVGSACRPPTSKNRTKPRCRRWVAVGSFRVVGQAGSNTAYLPSRVGGKALGPGHYELVATATDPAGSVSASSKIDFKIAG
jgi:hypothetical protein